MLDMGSNGKLVSTAISKYSQNIGGVTRRAKEGSLTASHPLLSYYDDSSFFSAPLAGDARVYTILVSPEDETRPFRGFHTRKRKATP